jgi:flagellar basal-body rod modification protein FlgD
MSIAGLDTVQMRGSEYTSSDSSVLGKDDFLQLLVAQLKAQDPLNPMESTAFTAQLAQFSSLEQLYNVNDSLGNMLASQASLSNAQTVGFIGKTVRATGNSIEVKDGISDALDFELPSDAKAVFIDIYDSAGGFVRRIESHTRGAGKQSLKWDGADDRGKTVSDGVYTFEVSAVGFQDEALHPTTMTTGKVTGVTFENGMSCLMAGNKKIPLNTLVEVSESED